MGNEETFIDTPEGLPPIGELAVLRFADGGEDRMYIEGYTEGQVRVRFPSGTKDIHSSIARASFEKLMVRE